MSPSPSPAYLQPLLRSPWPRRLRPYKAGAKPHTRRPPCVHHKSRSTLPLLTVNTSAAPARPWPPGHWGQAHPGPFHPRWGPLRSPRCPTLSPAGMMPQEPHPALLGEGCGAHGSGDEARPIPVSRQHWPWHVGSSRPAPASVQPQVVLVLTPNKDFIYPQSAGNSRQAAVVTLRGVP